MEFLKNKISGRIAVILISSVVLIAVGLGATIAYLMTRTPPVENTFTPVAVSCLIHEDFDTANNVKRDVSVENTGDISAYIRVAIVVNWISESGTIYGDGPILDQDYTITMTGGGWFVGSDGFYYYESPVSAGGSTTILFDAISPISGTEPEGYSLSVKIVASAIQSDPGEAVMTAWRNVTVNDDGRILPKSNSEE